MDAVRAAERARITLRDLLAHLDLLGKDAQLLEQDGGLDGVEPRVHADADVLVLVRALAVDTDGAQKLVQLAIVGEARPAVAIAAEWLGRKEARSGGVANGARAFSVEQGTEPLRGVAEHLELFAGDD